MHFSLDSRSCRGQLQLPRQWPKVCYCLVACLQIYEACKERGRIAYKRSGGSRLITHNEHWKSQIRHALYTSDRFVRCSAECETSAGLHAWAF